MNYVGITKASFVNGEGVRTVLWVSGCVHHCEECHNPYTWNPDSGMEFTDEIEKELFDVLDRPIIDGITISGGDPLYIYNRHIITRLCKRIRYKYNDTKTIWVYTGYLWEQVKILNIMQYIDVLVDGPYRKGLESIKWCGSSNQRVIDVQKSLQSNEVVLYGEKK